MAVLASRGGSAARSRAPVARRGGCAPAAASAEAATSAEAAAAQAAAAAPPPPLPAQCSVLLAALEKAPGVCAALAESPATLFAPTDAAFEALCKDVQLTKTQLLDLEPETLEALLKYHAVPGVLASGDLGAAGASATLLGEEAYGKELALAAGSAGGARVVEADLAGAAGGVVHVVDKVLVPPFTLPSTVREPADVLAFEGWAPEVVNGRCAMLGFALAVYGEFAGHGSVLEQAGADPAHVLRTFAVWFAASLAPALHSSYGGTADPKTLTTSDEWAIILRGGPDKLVAETLTAEVELTNGRAAMVGLVGLALVEAALGHALF